MYHRFLSSALRILNPNTNQCPDNPLQVDRLPDDSRVELDYPVYQDSRPVMTRRLLTLICGAALVAPILTWITGLIALPFVPGGGGSFVLFVAAVMITIGVLAPRVGLFSLAASLAVLPIMATLTVHMPLMLAAYLLIAIAQVFFADRLVTCYLYLKTAAPTPHSIAIGTRVLWRRRKNPFCLRSLRGAELYWLPYALVLPISVAFIVVHASMQITFQYRIAAAFLAFAFLGAIAYVVALPVEWGASLLFWRRRLLWKAQIVATWHALQEWVSYNRLNTRGPGVHRNLAGTCVTRRYLLLGYILAWSVLWFATQRPNAGLPFMLSYALEQVASMEGVMEAFSMTPPKVERRPFEPSLAEQQFLSMLPEDKRNELLAEMRQTHQEEYEREYQDRANQQVTRNPAGLLIRFFEYLVSACLDVIVPIVSILSIAFLQLLALVGRPLASIEMMLGSEPRKRVFSTENWNALIDRVQDSEDDIEKRSILVGVNSRDDTPVLVPRDVFREHAHILGDSGSGKTSIGLLPLISQLMRRGDCSVLVIDLKADDQSVFETLKYEADAATRYLQGLDPATTDFTEYPLRWFTTVMGRGSYAFNPLAQAVMPDLAIDQRADLIINALGLNYGTDYGRAYFGDANFEVLRHALAHNPEVSSFAELADVLKGVDRFPLPEEVKKRAGVHIRSAVSRLGHIRALNASEYTKASASVLASAIDMSQLFQQPQAVYFALPPLAGVANTERIARIALYSLLTAAQQHKGERKQVFLVVDEFQRIVSNNIELFLQQARSMDIGCILSNQSLSDLEKVDSNLISAVRTNTRFRQVFGAATIEDIRDLIDTAGQSVYGMRSWKFDPTFWEASLTDFSITESVSTRLNTNDILLATDAPGRSITCIRRGAGYAQFGGMPFVMDSVHHIDKKLHDAHRRADWPAADANMVVSTKADADLAAAGPLILDSGPVIETPVTLASTRSRKKTSARSRSTPAAPPPTQPVPEEKFDFDLEQIWLEQQERDTTAKAKKKAKRKRQPPPDQPSAELPQF